jgi:hypothetical protein
MHIRDFKFSDNRFLLKSNAMLPSTVRETNTYGCPSRPSPIPTLGSKRFGMGR